MNRKKLTDADIELFKEMLAKIGKKDIRVCQHEAIKALEAYRKNQTIIKTVFFSKFVAAAEKHLLRRFSFLKKS